MDPFADAPASRAGPGNDPALLPYLRTSDAAEADRLLADLIRDRVLPTIRDVARRGLFAHAPSGAWTTADVEDVCGDAVARVLRTLRELKDRGAREPIHSFDAYAARITEHVCYEHFRRRRPARARLRNQIWYVLTHNPDLLAVRAAGGGWWCRVRDGHEPDARHRTVRRLDDRSVPGLVRSTLSRLGREADLNELVDLIADALGIRESSPGGAAADDGIESQRDQMTWTPLTGLEHRQYLEQLWREVQELPLRQRMALLLNLRDDHGGDALDLLPRTGIATIREIASALGIAARELAELWPDLPLDDRQIAARLGLSRQQIINLRKAARARLARRMSTFDASGDGARGNSAAVSRSKEGKPHA
jgi:RNA polymerase sigma factor (sigma-70 family)